MTVFTGKKILLISPESWGVSMLSKHYYAKHLCAAGNEVWFLQPGKVTVQSNITRLHLVEDVFFFPGQRFLPVFMQRAIHRISIRLLKKKTTEYFDIVWSFDDSRWFHYDLFNAPISIYHAVDEHAIASDGRGAKTARFSIGLTPRIVNKLEKHCAHTLQLPHGYEPAREIHDQLPIVKEKRKAGYCGNLLLPFIHWPSIMATIQQSPDVHFFFIGSSGQGNLNPHHKSTSPIIEQLLSYTNVSLLGEKSPDQLHSLLSQMDILFYSLHFSDGRSVENTHKLVNYLATGKTIVGTPLSASSLASPTLITAPVDEFERIFRQTLNNIDQLNSQENAQKRINHLSKNNYSHLLLTISSWIDHLK
jgi:hypothetical protein